MDSKQKLQFISWQNNYSSGRRRFKPTSEGVTLKIDKKTLFDYLSKKGLELRFDYALSRFNDKYKSESEMTWHKKTGSFKGVIE